MRVIEPISGMRLTHTSVQVEREEGEERRDIEPIQVYALDQYTDSSRWRGGETSEPSRVCAHTHTTLQVERRESHSATSKCMRSPPHQLQVERERHRANQVCAHHTPATGGEERVIEPIKCMRSPHTATGGEERES